MPDPLLQGKPCDLVVLWIDWYAYHVARFRGILSVPSLAQHAVGIEMVGGVGVHAGLKFRQPLPAGLPIETLMPDADWLGADKLKLAAKVWRALARLNPKTVLVPGYYTLPALAAAAWAKLHGRTSVLMTESASYDHPRSALKERIKGTAIRLLFDWAVSGGKDHVDYLRQLGFPRTRIAGFYDVVENRLYGQHVALRADVRSDLPDRFFLFVGRLSPEKNAVHLLRAWHSYRDAGGNWSLILAGDGPESAQLHAEASKSNHAAAFTITGLKSSGELLPYYAAASCFVLPSTREPWGLVVNEAMASGLPVLVSNRCGCARDLVVDGENGFTFDPGDGARLVQLLHTMEHLHPVALQAMGNRGREVIADYSPEHFGMEIARIAAESSSSLRQSLEYTHG